MMGDREDFLDWFNTTWRSAEVALHNGDAGSRLQTWSERAPGDSVRRVAQRFRPGGVRDVFQKLADAFSEATSNDIDLVAADVSGNLAYTVQREITSATVNGTPREYVLRVTQVYRREDGTWKVVHRHGDDEREVAQGQ